MVELINTACQYTPPLGEIVVNGQAHSPGVEIRVRNTGVEIAETELLRIFDWFYRIPTADMAKQGGTGLGLALVKKMVTYLGGTIHVSSGTGQTVFIVQCIRSGERESREAGGKKDASSSITFDH